MSKLLSMLMGLLIILEKHQYMHYDLQQHCSVRYKSRWSWLDLVYYNAKAQYYFLVTGKQSISYAVVFLELHASSIGWAKQIRKKDTSH